MPFVTQDDEAVLREWAGHLKVPEDVLNAKLDATAEHRLERPPPRRCAADAVAAALLQEADKGSCAGGVRCAVDGVAMAPQEPDKGSCAGGGARGVQGALCAVDGVAAALLQEAHKGSCAVGGAGSSVGALSAVDGPAPALPEAANRLCGVGGAGCAMGGAVGEVAAALQDAEKGLCGKKEADAARKHGEGGVLGSKAKQGLCRVTKGVQVKGGRKGPSSKEVMSKGSCSWRKTVSVSSITMCKK